MIEEHTYTLRLDPERIRVAMHDLASLTYKIAFEDDQQRRVVVQGVPSDWFYKIADEYADNDEKLKLHIARLTRELEAKEAALSELTKARYRDQADIERAASALKAATRHVAGLQSKIERQSKALRELDAAHKKEKARRNWTPELADRIEKGNAEFRALVESAAQTRNTDENDQSASRIEKGTILQAEDIAKYALRTTDIVHTTMKTAFEDGEDA